MSRKPSAKPGDGVKAVIQKIRSEPVITPGSLVDHPAHYNQGGVECIDGIEAALGREQFIGFLRGQILKYEWRLGHKDDAAQDHAKACWYAAKLTEVLGRK